MRISDKMIVMRKLLCFLSVAQEGTLSGAALKGGLKQSNLSLTIKELEELVDCKLFTRVSRGVRLTDAGKTVYEIACDVDKSIARINNFSAEECNISGSVRLWTSNGLAAGYLSSCLPGFYAKYPDVRIDIVCSIDAPNVLYDADLALVFEEPRQTDAVILSKHNLKFGLFASLDYLANNGSPKDLEDLQKNHKICTRNNFADVWEEWGKFISDSEHVVVTTNSSTMLMRLTRDSIGVALHPLWIAKQEKELVYLDKMGMELSHPFWLISHKDAKDQAKVRALIEYIKDATEKL